MVAVNRRFLSHTLRILEAFDVSEKDARGPHAAAAAAAKVGQLIRCGSATWTGFAQDHDTGTGAVVRCRNLSS
jgi:hypothetical protein